MVKEYTYSPHVDFYIDMIDREHSYDMGSFHTHHKNAEKKPTIASIT